MKPLTAPHAALSANIAERSQPGWLSSRWLFAALIAATAVYYLFLLSNGTFRVFAPEMLDQAYSSMLVHMLHGQFDVDPKAIDFEGFTHDGKTYAYFGVFPALLRLPILPFGGIGEAPIARLSCLTAVVLYVALQLRMLQIVHETLPPENRVRGFLAVMAAATVLSGPQLYILGSASIYHEPILWSAAMAAASNVVILRAAIHRGCLDTPDLICLAILAGLAINTRASVGIALCVTATLLIGWTAWQKHASGRGEAGFPEIGASPPAGIRRAGASAVRMIARYRSILLAMTILAALVAPVGAINFARWGNPLTFADFHYYYWGLRHPNFLNVLRDYGPINFGRMWIGALYYSTGIPYLVKDAPPFAGFLSSRLAGIEAPPFTPLLTNPLTILLALMGLYCVFGGRALPRLALAPLRLALIGHAFAILLILAAMYLTMRFRFDFAAFMTLAAVLGYRAVSIATGEAPEQKRRRRQIAAVGLCALGIVGSHYVLLVHKVWSIAVPMEVRTALLPYAPFASAALGR